MLRSADAVLIFERDQRQFIEAAFPAFRPNLRHVGLLDALDGAMIRCPVDDHEDSLLEVYAAISALSRS
jgi:hypothetical protein